MKFPPREVRTGLPLRYSNLKHDPVDRRERCQREVKIVFFAFFADVALQRICPTSI